MSWMKLWLVTPTLPNEDEIEKLLDKYQIENEKYFVFIDKAEEYLKEYQTKGTKVIYKENGRWWFPWNDEAGNLIWNDREKREANEKLEVFKYWRELYPTFKDFVKDYHENIVEEEGIERIGYYKNPYGRFDHYNFTDSDFGWNKDIILKDGFETFQGQKKSIDLKEMHWRVRKNSDKGWKLSKVHDNTPETRKSKLELENLGYEGFGLSKRYPKLKDYLNIYGNNWPFCILVEDSFYSKNDEIDLFEYHSGLLKDLFNQKCDEQKSLWNKTCEYLWNKIPEDHWITVIALHY